MNISRVNYPTPINYSNKTNNLYSRSVYKGDAVQANHCSTINFKGKFFDFSKISLFYKPDQTTKTAKSLWNEIKRAKNIVILTHEFADGDAVGSGLALLSTLRTKFKNKNIQFVVPDGIPSMLKATPGVELITSKPPNRRVDLAIALDCDEQLLDGLEIYKTAKKRINIDHHATNLSLENKNEIEGLTLVDAQSPSTTGILYNKLFKPLNINVSSEVAECLLTGLVTDTGNFRNINDTRAFALKDEFLKIAKMPSVDCVTEKFQSNRKESDELNKMKLELYSPQHLETFYTKSGHTVACAAVTRLDLAQFGVKDSEPDIFDGIKSIASYLKRKADIGLVFYQTKKGDMKVSLRSDTLLLKTFATRYEGGGHESAIGFTVNGRPEKIFEDFILKLKNFKFKENYGN